MKPIEYHQKRRLWPYPAVLAPLWGLAPVSLLYACKKRSHLRISIQIEGIVPQWYLTNANVRRVVHGKVTKSLPSCVWRTQICISCVCFSRWNKAWTLSHTGIHMYMTSHPYTHDQPPICTWPAIPVPYTLVLFPLFWTWRKMPAEGTQHWNDVHDHVSYLLKTVFPGGKCIVFHGFV